jgi:hypothetical protein
MHLTTSVIAAKARSLALLVIFVLASDDIAPTQLLNGLKSLTDFADGLRSPWGRDALLDLVRPGSGEQVLPSPVKEMLLLLRGYDVNEYAISPKIADTSFLSKANITLLRQRITESAYPRRRLDSARHYLAFMDEDLPKGCRSIAAEKEIKLAICD